MAPVLRTRGDQVLVEVAVSPGARHDALQGEYDQAVKISLKSRAVEGRANAALIRFLSAALDLPRRDIQIVRGGSSRRKTVALAGASVADVRRRLLGAPVA